MRPAQLVGESIRALERKGLAINPVALVLVELSSAGRRDGGHTHRLVVIAETATQLDVPARHPAQVGAVILGDE